MSVSFVHNELLKLRNTKATGLDTIPMRLLKDGANEIAKSIPYLINFTVATGEIPLEWKEAKVTLVFKSDKRSEEHNY